jgi:hypothetical protein
MYEEEYTRFWGYKRSIVGIVARNFVRINLIAYESLRKELDLDVDMMNLGHCYVDRPMLSKLTLENKRRHCDRVYDVAISYASEDKEIAQNLFDLLTEMNLEVFYDKDAEHRTLGSEAMGLLFDVFNHEASYVVILCSEWTIKKPWAEYEFRLAVNREERQKGSDIFVLPIRIDDTEIPFLTSKMFAHCKKQSLREIADLVYKRVKHASEPEATRS